MDARQAALGGVLGLAAVIELASRLTGTSTLRAGLATAAAAHSGVSTPTALVICGFCLLATVPAGLFRPVPAAVTVVVASVLSLVLFELVTGAGAAALLVAAYRLARGAPDGARRRFLRGGRTARTAGQSPRRHESGLVVPGTGEPHS